MLPSVPPDALIQKTIAAVKAPPAFHGSLQLQSQLLLPLNPSDPSGASAPGSRIVRIWHNPPDRWRVESYTSEGATDTYLAVADGRTVLSWDARTNTYRMRPQPPPSSWAVPGLGRIDRWLLELQNSTRLTMDPNATVAGRLTYHLVASPTAPEVLVGSLQVWIDGETFLPLQVELTDRSGSVVLRARFRDIAYATSDPSLFSALPPKDATAAPRGSDNQQPTARPAQGFGVHPHLTPTQQLEAAQSQVDFRLAQPQHLPAGRGLSGVTVHGDSVIIRYGQSWQTLVMVEGRSGQPLAGGRPVQVGGATGQLITDRVVSVVSWVAGGVRHILAGSLAPDGLLEVARSVR